MRQENSILLNFMEYIVGTSTFKKWGSGYQLYFKDKYCNFLIFMKQLVNTIIKR